jgi:DNA invertase Pin-like site-specific DNA recombinase
MSLGAETRKGKRLGRPPVFVPLTQARALIEGGLSVAGAARELGVSRSTLIRTLSRNVPSKAAASA